MPDIGGGKPGSVSGPQVTGAQIVEEALKFVNKVPYVYGGTTPKGFDCSGLVQYVFKQYGFTLPRTSEEQAKWGVSIKESDLQPGDLIISDWGDGPASHVAIYAGNGKLIEAPHTGEDVHEIAFDANYKAHASSYRRLSGSFGAGNVAPGGSGGPNISGLFGDISNITNFFGDAADDLSSAFNLFTAFFRPSTYVRIGAGFLGAIFLVAGLVFLIIESVKE